MNGVWTCEGDSGSRAIVWARSPHDAVDWLDEVMSIAAHELVRIRPSYLMIRQTASGWYSLEHCGPIVNGGAGIPMRAWLCPRASGAIALAWAPREQDAREIIGVDARAPLVLAVPAFIQISPELDLATQLMEQLDPLFAAIEACASKE